jgi:hypothetical protein
MHVKPPSTLSGVLLLYAVCALAAWLAWPLIKTAMPDSFPQDAGRNGALPYDEYGSDPGRFDRWRGGQRGGYSPYHPGRPGGGR